MEQCKDCLHLEACKQWYTALPDKYHNGCEHFKDRSHFVELPCNIGDKIYVIHRAKDGNGHVQPLICSALHLRDEINRRRIKKKYEYVVAKHDGYCAAHLDLTKLGIDWFVNYEAAKKALEEWREEVKEKK